MKRCASVALAAVLTLLMAAGAFAQTLGFSVTLGLTGRMEGDPVSSCGELQRWVNSHKRSGGTAYLTQDITVGPGEQLSCGGMYGSPDIVIDVGEYSITVRGIAQIFPNVVIRGRGGGQGLLRVEKGGWLTVASLKKLYPEGTVSLLAQGEFAVRQERGGFLELAEQGETAVEVEGKVGYLPYALVKPLDTDAEEIPVVIVGENERAEGADYPQTVPALFNENGIVRGDQESVQAGVAWDLDSAANAMGKRHRVLLTGHFQTDAVEVEPPVCLVVFRQGPLTLLQCWFDSIAVYLTVTTPPEESTWAAEMSADGETWEKFDPGELDCYQSGSATTLILYGAEERFRYFRVRAEIDGQVCYSDIVERGEAGMSMEHADVIGGNRGGGTELPTLGESRAYRPEGASVGPGWKQNENEKEAKPEHSHAADCSGTEIPPAVRQELSVPSSDVAAAAAAEFPADRVSQPSQAEKSSAGTERQTVPAADAPHAGELSKNGQVAIGLAATAAILGVTVLWYVRRYGMKR